MSNSTGFPSPSSLGILRGASGPVVGELQAYLHRYGYLRTPASVAHPMTPINSSAPEAVPDVFDESTEIALKKYQQFFGLTMTGILDSETIAQMQKPRCGVPDPVFGPISFVLQGARWSQNNITYQIQNFSQDLGGQDIRNALRIAFNTWSRVTPLCFTEVNSNADIILSFVTGDHGDGFPFDRPEILAHAFPPPPGNFAGDVHFDDDEDWSIGILTGIDLVTVAIHEIGHALGLDHTPVEDAVMFATYEGLRRQLHQDDIQGIQSVYLLAPIPVSARGKPVALIYGETDDPTGDVRINVFGRASSSAGFPIGNIWEYFWNGQQWLWRDTGQTLSHGDPTAVIRGETDDPTGDVRINVFARGANGNLWEYFLDGQPCGSWRDTGQRVEGTPAAVIRGETDDPTGDVRINVFVRGANDNLWEYFWNGQQWGWRDTGQAVWGDPVAVIRGETDDPTGDARINVFVQGANLNLWEYFWNGQQWGWRDTGQTVEGNPTAVIRGETDDPTGDVRINVFVRGANGNLWEYFWNGQQWGWRDTAS